jgi:hypothetical protein
VDVAQRKYHYLPNFNSYVSPTVRPICTVLLFTY